jgi:site-specific DNA recombinase
LSKTERNTETARTSRAAGYTRVSTSRQADEGLSLDAQRQRIEQYAAAQGWELVEIYEERGVSGRKAERPALSRLLAERDRFDRLIVPKLDRLGRSAPNVYATIGKLREAGITLVSIDPPIDAGTREGRLMLNMLIGVAEMESDLNSERVRDTAEARVARGRDYGSRRPLYGYRRGEDGILVPVAEQAAVVRRVFEAFLGGMEQRAIERSLREDNIPASAGGQWRAGLVWRMLRRVEYTGLVRGPSGALYEGKQDPIIDAETFERTQALLAANGKAKIMRTTASGHLLRGKMLVCGHCGGTMHARTEKGKGWYICATRTGIGGKADCPMTRVRREAVEEPLLAYFRDEILDLDMTRARIEEIAARKVEEARTLREHAERQAALAEARLARVRRDYQDERITAEDWGEQRDELTGEAEAARAEAARLAKREAEASETKERLGEEEHLLGLLHELRASIIESVREADDEAGREAVRAALTRLFQHFVICRTDTPWASHGEAGVPGVPFFARDGFVIVPVPQPDAFVGLAPVTVRMTDGSLATLDLPKLQTVPLTGDDIAAFCSQKTSVPPRRATRSSS